MQQQGTWFNKASTLAESYHLNQTLASLRVCPPPPPATFSL